MFEKIITITVKKDFSLFIKTEEHDSVYVKKNETSIPGGIKNFFKIFKEGKAYAEVKIGEKGAYAEVVGSKRHLNCLGYGDPNDVASAKLSAETRRQKRRAEKEARHQAWLDSCKKS